MKRVAFLLATVAALASSCAAAQERTINKEVVVKAPAAEVWKAWSTAEGLQSFFAPEALVDLRPGGMFEIHFNPYGAPGTKGAEGTRVLAVQEGKMLSFTWDAPPYFPEVRSQNTYVTVRVKPISDAETRVTLVQGGWGDGGEWDQVFDYFNKAWSAVLGNLQKRFVEGPIDWKPFLARLKADSEKAQAAKP
jgi:uncharacterized protein YndB with AHSA1/START domain